MTLMTGTEVIITKGYIIRMYMYYIYKLYSEYKKQKIKQKKVIIRKINNQKMKIFTTLINKIT